MPRPSEPLAAPLSSEMDIEPASTAPDAMPTAAPSQPATSPRLAPQPPAPPLVQLRLACCADGGVRVVLAVVGEEWVRLELSVQPNGAVAATLTVASSECDPAAEPAAAVLPADEPAAALEQEGDNQEEAAAAVLRQQYSVLLQENGRLQCLVRQVCCLPCNAS